jgi:hypothetical protein
MIYAYIAGALCAMLPFTILLFLIYQKVNTMALNTQALSDAVTANTTATNAAVAEIQSLISGSGEQAAQAAIDAATAQVTANNAALTGAVPAPAQ